jgi:hypothetical protein
MSENERLVQLAILREMVWKAVGLCDEIKDGFLLPKDGEVASRLRDLLEDVLLRLGVQEYDPDCDKTQKTQKIWA